MNCPRVDELVLLLDGELSVNRSAELRSHLPQCQLCSQCFAELQRTVQRLAPDPEDADLALVEDIVSAAAAGDAMAAPLAASRRWWRVALPAAGLAAAAALMLMLLRPGLFPRSTPREGDSTFTARGSQGIAQQRWLAMWIYQRRAGRSYEEVAEAASIAADARLAFGYLNQEGAYRYLMVFAVSERGQVFWYYPAYLKKDSNPTSIAITRGRQELDDEIQHDLLPGRLRVTALFSKHPLRVSEIEQQLRAKSKTRGAETAELGLKDTIEISRSVVVRRGVAP
jgi:hypothetical protein